MGLNLSQIINKMLPVQLVGSNIPQGQEIPVKPGIASDSWTTHNQVTISASGAGSYVNLPVTGYRKAMLIVYSTTGFNCHAKVVANSRAGASYNVQLATTSAGVTSLVEFDLNGLDSIGVNVFNDDATNTNTIVCDVFVQG